MHQASPLDAIPSGAVSVPRAQARSNQPANDAEEVSMSVVSEPQKSPAQAVPGPQDSVLAHVADAGKDRREALLAAYTNAYAAGLVHMLSQDYRQLAAFLGDKQFDLMARTFALHNPANPPDGRRYGTGLPEFLGAFSPYKERPLLADLARLERALTSAVDAPKVEPLAVAELGAIPAEKWATMTFTPHPAVQRVDLRTNAVEVWSELQNGTAPSTPRLLAQTDQILVYRKDRQVKFRRLAPDEAMMWDEATKGARFSLLCEMMAMFGRHQATAARAASYIKSWTAAGMLVKAAPGGRDAGRGA